MWVSPRDLVTPGRMRRRNSSICRCATGTTLRRVSRVSWARPTHALPFPLVRSPCRRCVFGAQGMDVSFTGILSSVEGVVKGGMDSGKITPADLCFSMQVEPRPEVGSCTILWPVSCLSFRFRVLARGTRSSREACASIGQRVRAVRGYQGSCRSFSPARWFPKAIKRRPKAFGKRRACSSTTAPSMAVY